MNETNSTFARELERRTKNFAATVYGLLNTFPSNQSSFTIQKQLFRSASSIGANYREANRAKSFNDFRNKIKICEGEASETVYWLELSQLLDLGQIEKLNITLNESKELLAIFSSVSKKLRAKDKASA